MLITLIRFPIFVYHETGIKLILDNNYEFYNHFNEVMVLANPQDSVFVPQARLVVSIQEPSRLSCWTA